MVAWHVAVSNIHKVIGSLQPAESLLSVHKHVIESHPYVCQAAVFKNENQDSTAIKTNVLDFMFELYLFCKSFEQPACMLAESQVGKETQFVETVIVTLQVQNHVITASNHEVTVQCPSVVFSLLFSC